MDLPPELGASATYILASVPLLHHKAKPLSSSAVSEAFSIGSGLQELGATPAHLSKPL